ncbi:hypothetical protein HOLleu_09748 [Holothuria leucospilota]|uniref:Uncharacterized protein n=1 Tax=Holothuria leucospilota TaxID=206669 RepID=A0A9Q1CE56_HOLLE|nr:hypothetical protein HOLleu_09748 [Holothuria leucospilota]
MSVSRGFTGNREVSVLRDNGCSTVVSRRSLVGDEQLTGNVCKCVLLDGTNNPLYDLVLGNVQEVRNPWDPKKEWQSLTGPKKETCAVETRAMLARKEKPVPPLKVAETLAEVASKEDISKG